MRLSVLVAGLGFSALLACGSSNSLPNQPQINTDRDTVDFGQSAGLGTYIGTVPQDSLKITNGGIQQLVISSATLAGDSVFTMVGPSTTQIHGLQSAFITVYFAPTAEQVYNATLTINSNAQNAPTKTVNVTGKGIRAPDAGP